jgi:hypothetical protein
VPRGPNGFLWSCWNTYRYGHACPLDQADQSPLHLLLTAVAAPAVACYRMRQQNAPLDGGRLAGTVIRSTAWIRNSGLTLSTSVPDNTARAADHHWTAAQDRTLSPAAPRYFGVPLAARDPNRSEADPEKSWRGSCRELDTLARPLTISQKLALTSISLDCGRCGQTRQLLGLKLRRARPAREERPCSMGWTRWRAMAHGSTLEARRRCSAAGATQSPAARA